MQERELLFTLTPKTGFYTGPNKAAMLNSAYEYCPSGAMPQDREGYASITYYPEGLENCHHVRLWSTAPGHKKLCTHFDLETTSPGETSDFWFTIEPPGGGWIPLQKSSVQGSQRLTLKVEFDLDVNGDALIGM